MGETNKIRYQVDITKDGVCYPDEVVVTINKMEIFKHELQKYVEEYKTNEELGKV